MYACGNIPKRGDIVRLKRGFGMSAENGAMARVKRIYEQDENIYVDIIWLNEKAKNQSYGGYNSDYFELVSRWVEEVLIKHQYDIIDKWGKEGIELFRKFYKIVGVTDGVSLRRLA